MKRVVLNLILAVFCCGIAQSQTVFNPNDPVTNYAGGNSPAVPYNNTIIKWVRTPKVAGTPAGTPGISWNTTRYKCYIVGDVPFRLRYPNSFVPGANDGKKYPIMVFWHGGGEVNSNLYDNEYHLYQGAQNFEFKAANDEDCFILFPQAPGVGWSDYFFQKMNVVIDSLVKNCKGDEDRVISMGLSMGGLGSVNYAVNYPKRVSTVIASSPAGINNVVPYVNNIVQIPFWVSNGGLDNSVGGPDSATMSLFNNAYRGAGGVLQHSYFPIQGHVAWDYQWAEEPTFDSVWSQANKSNPVVYNNNRFFCPGNPVSAQMGLTAGFFAYEWSKDGVTIPGATSSNYTATDFGVYRARFKRADTSTNWSAWSLAPARIVAVCPPVVGTGIGLTGTYYNGIALGGTGTARTDASLNFYIENSTSPFSAGVSSGGNFSTRWIGKLQAQFTETYTIYTKNDDGIRLWLNGQLLIDNWATHSGVTENTVNVSLIAGQQYDFKIEYYNTGNFQNNGIYNSPLNYNTGILSVKWSSPSTVKQMIPKSQLYNTGTGVATTLPLCTTNLTPANATVIPSTTSTTLTWSPVSNAGTYDLYFAAGTATPTVVTASNLTTTSYTATVAAGTTYTWFVIPKNNVGSAANCGTNNKTSFTVSAPIPACVTNTSPANGNTLGTTSTATLVWGSSATATSYDVYLWPTSGSAPVTPTANVASATYNATNLSPNTNYSWYVAPRNVSGVATTCAGSKTNFTTAILLVPNCVTNTAPANGEVLTTQTSVSLSWPSSPTATSYDIFLWPTSGSAPATASYNSATTSFDITSGLTPSTSYSWYIAPKNASGANAGCAGTKTTTFTTAAPLIPAPGCTNNTSPADAAVIGTQTTAVLTWDAVGSATSYDVYVWPSSGSAPGTATGTVTSATYTAIGLTAATPYSWYVVPKNATGPATGCISNKTTFTTAINPPASCATLTAPLNNAVLGTQTTASFGWNTVAAATSYDIYVWPSTGSAPATPSKSGIAGLTYDTTGLIANTAYKWYIVPRNAGGPAAGCASGFFTFTTAVNPPAGCATLTAPLNNAVLGTQTTASFAWNTVAGASSYDIYVWPSTGSAPATPSKSGITALTYDTTGLIAATSYKWYIIPRNAGGPNTACSSSFFTFTTAINVPSSCATLTAPLNNAVLGTSNSASFAWNTVADATSYDIYVWPSTGSAPASPSKSGITGLTYDTTGLIANTAYKWYIVPRNAGGPAVGCASGFFTFTTSVSAPAGCATLTAPLNNAVLGTQTTASFAWNTVTGATSYDIYVWPSTGSAPATPSKSGITGLTYDTTGLLAATSYKWYIIPRNAGGPNTGCASSFFTFTTAINVPTTCATLTAPLNNAVLGTSNSASFAWNTVSDATLYDIYIWPSTGSAPATPSKSGIVGLTYDTTGLIANTAYKWYVVPRNAGGAAVNCAAGFFTFTTSVAAPASCATLTAPLNNAVLNTQNTASFAWNTVTGATSYDIYVWLSTGSAPATPSKSGIVGLTYDTTGLISNTSYKWYIVPRNAGGPASGCASGFFTFTTAVDAPTVCPVLTAPLNGSTLSSPTNASFTWNTVPGAASYDIYVWVSSTPILAKRGIVGTSYDTTGLSASVLYKWAVVPRNAGGTLNSCTNTPFTFTTSVNPPASCPILTAPANNAVLGTANSASFAWNSVANAASYDIYVWVGTGSAPASPSKSNIIGLTYDTTGLIAGTNYKWYVVPKNAGGAATGCSSGFNTFTTGFVLSCTTNTLPAAGATIATPNSAALSWTAAANATSYDIYLWTGGTAATTPIGNSTTNSFNALNLLAASQYTWYVVPKNGASSASGCASSATIFTTSAAAPSCTLTTQPVNGSTITSSSSTTLTWGAVSNATAYDLYLWMASQGQSATPFATNIATASYNVTGLTAATEYNWYIVPKNANGSAANCFPGYFSRFYTSALAAPACATNLTPSSGSILGSATTVTLTWSSVPTAISYDVYVWTGSNVFNPSLTANVPTPSYTTSSLIGSTNYNWYVVPRNSSGPANSCAGSNTWTFTTASSGVAVPTCTNMSNPANNSVISDPNSILLTWGISANTTAYDVYIWQTNATAPLTPTYNISGSDNNYYYVQNLSPSTSYTWYVVPRNAGGPASGCSATTSRFTTAAASAPACVSNYTYPTGGQTIPGQTAATLIWQPVAGAVSYDVYLWTGGVAPTTPVGNTTSAYGFDINGLVAGTIYNWYVVPKNAAGSATGCAGAATTFVTAALSAPSCTTLSSPLNNAVLSTQTTASLQWVASGSASSYDLYLGIGNNTPTSIAADIVTNNYSVTNLTANTSYKWYVVPKNAGGAATGCASGAFTFVTAVNPPASCATLTAPSNNAVLGTQTTASFAWNTVAGATSYDIYVWLSTGSAPATPSKSGIVGLTYDTTGLIAATGYKWYIVPRNAGGTASGCSSSFFSFTTAINVPASCAVLTAPLNNEVLGTSNSASFAWNTVANATSYDIYIWPSTGSAPATPSKSSIAGLTYDTTGLLASTSYKWYVVPRNAGGPAINCASGFFIFTTAVNAPGGCATLTAPSNNAVLGTQTTASFAWNTVPGATSYDIYVWQATGSAPATASKSGITGLTYDTTGLIAATGYKWYIVPRNAGGPASGCSSGFFSFTTAVNVPSTCATLTAPSNNAVLGTSTSASFGWNNVSDATSYDIYIWPSNGSAPATPSKSGIVGLTYDTTGLIASTSYKWYVVPRNAGGPAIGCAGGFFTFITAVSAPAGCATLTAPLNNAVLGTQTTASFAWNTVAGATSYDIYVWPSTGSAPATPSKSGIVGLTYDTTGLIAATAYKWYIVPRNAGGPASGCASGFFVFTTAVNPPASCAVLTAPLNNAVLGTSTSASFAWNTVPGAASYDIFVWPTTGSAPASPSKSGIVGLTYDTTGLVASTGYNWYVVPKNAGGSAAGCASGFFTFTTAVNAPAGCATLTAPANSAILGTQTTASFAWNTVPGATSYDIYVWVGTGSAPASPSKAGITGLTYDTTGLIANTNYKWYIVPRNAGGPATGCSSSFFTFTTAVNAPAGCATLTAPSNNAVLGTQTTASFAWNTVAGSTSYDIYIWPSTGSAPATPSKAGIVGLTYDTTGLIAATPYKWYIVPRNAGGPATGCAAGFFTFTTAVNPPASCATLTAPANNAVLGTSAAASFAWNTVANATLYDIYVWPSTGSAPATPSKSGIAGLTYDTTGLLASTSYKWYVVPRNAGGPATGCASGFFTFTTAALPVPVCIVNATPADGATLGAQTTATLTWPASSTATSYDVYLAAGAGTPTVLVTNTTALNYNATNLTAGTLYSWYIAPRNASGANTACGSTNTTTFTTAAAVVLAPCVINTLPANAATLPSQTSARLNWPASPGATSYDVYLATGNAVPTLLRTNTTALTYYATGLTAGTLYSWYIAPRNANGANTACGSTNRTTFTTATATGGGNIAPVANAGSNVTITLPVTTATLNGTASYDPDGSISEFFWYQASGPVTASITNFTATPTVSGLTTAGTYVIGLQVKDNNSVPAYSSVSIIVNPVGTPTVPACVINSTPAAGSTIATQNTATLTWPASSGATSYDVYLAAGNGVPATLVNNTTSLNYSASGLTANTTYSWYIAPRNSAGVASGCGSTNTTTFITAAVVTVPACVINASPGNGTTIATQTSVTLTWPASSGATSYDVYLAAGASTPTILVSNTSTLSYTSNSLNAGTTYSWYIAPRNAGGANTACAPSNVTTFITAAPTVPLAACVINASPGNGTTVASPTSANLTWPASANATSYDVYLAAGNGTPATLVTNTAALNYSATGLTANTLYSWYIAPRNASGANTGCAPGNVTTFTTALPPVPACASNPVPANGATIGTATTAALSWGAVSTATSYDVYVWPTAGSAPGTATATVATNSYNATSLTGSTSYSWYVVPKNAGGAAAGCAGTNTTTFTTAAPIVLAPCVINTSPANAATLPSQTSARLNWPASPGATSYDVYLAAGNAVPTILVSNTTALTYYATGLTAGTLYSWYIAPKNANGSNTACGSTNRTTFTTATATGGGNIAPVANGGSNVTITLPVSTATLNATASYDPDGSISEYYWYQASGPVTASITNFTATPTVSGLTTAGTYVFGLQVKDNNGVPAYSQATVIVNPVGTPTVPACVINSTPAAGSTIATQNTATLTWPASSGATSYDVYLAAGNGVPATLVNNTTSLNYSASGLTANTTYSWYIAPRNSAGVASGCGSTNTTTFITAAVVTVPACVINASPGNGTTIATQTSVTLTWPASSGATSYDVYLAAGTGTPTVLVNNTSTLSYTSNSLNAGTTYSWYIAPRNAGGANTACAPSNVTTFITAAPTVPLAACVINASPGNGTTVASPTSANLTWPASANATSYDVYLAAGNGTPATLVTNTAALNYSATGLTANTLYSWYIAPRNASGANTGCAPGNVTTFTTALPPVPACASNPVPANGATIGTATTAALSWGAVSTATSYDVYVWPTAGSAPGTATATVATNSYNATSLTGSTSYSWYVVPKNAGGAAAGCAGTNTTTFTTAAPIVLAPCVINTSPANAATLPSQTSARLNWPASSGATSYDVYLAAGNAVPTILVSNTTALTYYATGLTAGTLYSWYIAPKNANGSNTACGSTTRTTFTTATATGGGNIAPVANAGTNVSITLPVTTATLNGTASYDPDGSISEFYWYQASGPVTASITNFTATPTVSGLTTAGTYVFGLQVKDNNGVPSYSSVSVIVSGAGALIADAGTTTLSATVVTPVVSANLTVSSAVPVLTSTVSPNPVKPGQSARVQITSDKTGTAIINIVNSNGFIISTQKVNLVTGMNTTTISTSMLSQGLYIINITGGDKPLNIKLLVE